LNSLAVSALALLTAQAIKIFTVSPPRPARIIGSGGMPSSHAAFVTCLATQIGITHGINSDFFAITAVFSLITIYDAGGVRRSVGEQAKILNRIITEVNPAELDREKDNIKRELKELIGHTPFEILAGMMLGFIIAILAA